MPRRNKQRCGVYKTDATAAEIPQTSTENISDDGADVPHDVPSAEADCSSSLTLVPGTEPQSTPQHISEGNDHGGRKCEQNFQDVLASNFLKSSRESLNSEDNLKTEDMENICDDYSSAEADCSSSLTLVPGTETLSAPQHISEGNDHGGRKCEPNFQDFLASLSLKSSNESLNSEDSLKTEDMENSRYYCAHVPSDYSSADADCSSSLTSVPGTETQSTPQHISEGNDHGGRKFEPNFQDFLKSHFFKSSNESLNSENSLKTEDMESICDECAHVPPDYTSTEAECSSSLTSLPGTEIQSTYQHVSEGNDHGGKKYELKSSNESWNSEDRLSNSDQHFSTSSERSQSNKSGNFQTTPFNQYRNYSKVKPSLSVKKHREKQFSILTFQKPSNYMVECPTCKRVFHSKLSMDVHLRLYNCSSPKRGKGSGYCVEDENSDDSHQSYRCAGRKNHLSENTENSLKRNLHSQEKNASTNIISRFEGEKFEIPPLRQELKIPENSNCNSSLSLGSEKSIPFSNDNSSVIQAAINLQQSCHISYNNVTKSVSTNAELEKETLNSNILQTENSDANKETKNPGAIEVTNNSDTKEVTKNAGSNVVNKRCAANKVSKKPAASRSTVKIQEPSVFHTNVSKMQNVLVGSTSPNSSNQNYKGFGNRLFHKNLNTKKTDLDVCNSNSTKMVGSSVKISHNFCNSGGDRAKICTRSKYIATNLKNADISNVKVSKVIFRKPVVVNISDTNRAQGGKKIDSPATNIDDSNFSNTISTRKSLAFENSGSDRNKRCTKYIATKLDDSDISKTKVGIVTRSQVKKNSYADGSSFKKIVQKTVNDSSKSHARDAKGVERKIPKSVSRRIIRKPLAVVTSDADRARGCIKAKSIDTNLDNSNRSNTTVTRRVPPKSLAFENSGGDRNKICTRSQSITTNLKNSNITNTKVSKLILRKPLDVNTYITNRAQGGIKEDSTTTNTNGSNFSNTQISEKKSLAFKNSGGDGNKLFTKLKSVDNKFDSNVSNTKVGTVTRSYVKENSYADGSSFKKVVQKTVNDSKPHAQDTKGVERKIPKSVSRRILRKPLAAGTSDADRAQGCIKAKSIAATKLDDSNGSNTTVTRTVPTKSLAFENSGGDRNKIYTKSKYVVTNLDDSSFSTKKDVKGTVTRSRAKKIDYADGSSFKKLVQETVKNSISDDRDANAVKIKSVIHNVGDTQIKFLKKSAKSTAIENLDDNAKDLKRSVRKSAALCKPVTEILKGSTSKSSESSSRIKIRPSTLPLWKR